MDLRVWFNNMSRRAFERTKHKLPIRPGTLPDLDDNAIIGPAEFSAESSSGTLAEPTPRRPKTDTDKRTMELCLPREGARDDAMRAFEPFARLKAPSIVRSREMSTEDLLSLMGSWSFTIQCIAGQDFKRFYIEKVLSAGQVLVNLKLVTSVLVDHGMSQLLKEHPYYEQEAGFKQKMTAALRYQNKLSECRLEIGTSAYAIPLTST